MCVIGVTSDSERCTIAQSFSILADNVPYTITCSGSPPVAKRQGSQESIDVNADQGVAEGCSLLDAANSIPLQAGTEKNSWPASVAKEILSPVLAPEQHQGEKQPAKAGHERRGVPLSVVVRRCARLRRKRAPQSRWEAAVTWDKAACRRLPPHVYSTLCRTAAIRHWQYLAEKQVSSRAHNRPKPYARMPSRLHRTGASQELLAEWKRRKELCHACEEGPRNDETFRDWAMQSNQAASDASAQCIAAVLGIKPATAELKQFSCAAQERAMQPIDGSTHLLMQPESIDPARCYSDGNGFSACILQA